MTRTINEGLRTGDLKELVIPLISIDEYKSKLGDDKSVIVVAFFVEDEDPAADLSRFIEKGANKVLDTEPSPAPNEDGYYLVFVEFTRNEKFTDALISLIDEVKLLVSVDEWKFKPYNHKKAVELTKDNLTKYIDIGKKADKKKKVHKESVGAFLANSYLDNVQVHGETLVFEHMDQKHLFHIVDFGDGHRILKANGLVGVPFRIDESSRWRCSEIKNLLGGAWNVDMLGDVMVITHNSETDALLVTQQ